MTSKGWKLAALLLPMVAGLATAEHPRTADFTNLLGHIEDRAAALGRYVGTNFVWTRPQITQSMTIALGVATGEVHVVNNHAGSVLATWTNYLFTNLTTAATNFVWTTPTNLLAQWPGLAGAYTAAQPSAATLWQLDRQLLDVATSYVDWTAIEAEGGLQAWLTNAPAATNWHWNGAAWEIEGYTWRFEPPRLTVSNLWRQAGLPILLGPIVTNRTTNTVEGWQIGQTNVYTQSFVRVTTNQAEVYVWTDMRTNVGWRAQLAQMTLAETANDGTNRTLSWVRVPVSIEDSWDGAVGNPIHSPGGYLGVFYLPWENYPRWLRESVRIEASLATALTNRFTNFPVSVVVTGLTWSYSDRLPPEAPQWVTSSVEIARAHRAEAFPGGIQSVFSDPGFGEYGVASPQTIIEPVTQAWTLAGATIDLTMTNTLAWYGYAHAGMPLSRDGLEERRRLLRLLTHTATPKNPAMMADVYSSYEIRPASNGSCDPLPGNFLSTLEVNAGASSWEWRLDGGGECSSWRERSAGSTSCPHDEPYDSSWGWDTSSSEHSARWAENERTILSNLCDWIGARATFWARRYSRVAYPYTNVEQTIVCVEAPTEGECREADVATPAFTVSWIDSMDYVGAPMWTRIASLLPTTSFESSPYFVLGDAQRAAATNRANIVWTQTWDVVDAPRPTVSAFRNAARHASAARSVVDDYCESLCEQWTGGGGWSHTEREKAITNSYWRIPTTYREVDSPSAVVLWDFRGP